MILKQSRVLLTSSCASLDHFHGTLAFTQCFVLGFLGGHQRDEILTQVVPFPAQQSDTLPASTAPLDLLDTAGAVRKCVVLGINVHDLLHGKCSDNRHDDASCYQLPHSLD